jgi:prolyl 4-hydroxylase
VYFTGEEITLAVRAFTHGYDLFEPSRIIVWHQYVRADQRKHWDDHLGDGSPAWHERDAASRTKVRRLFEEPDFGPFGLGTERTLEDYEAYAGLSFRHHQLQDYTRHNLEPPNPPASPDWPTRVRDHEVDITVEAGQLSPEAFDVATVWCIGVHDIHGAELCRHDINFEDLPTVNGSQFTTTMRFTSQAHPATWTINPHSKIYGWLPPLTRAVTGSNGDRQEPFLKSTEPFPSNESAPDGLRRVARRLEKLAERAYRMAAEQDLAMSRWHSVGATGDRGTRDEIAGVDLTLITNSLTEQKGEDTDRSSQRIVLDNEKLSLPHAQRVPTYLAELYVLDDFLNQRECERLTTLIESQLSSRSIDLHKANDPLIRVIDDRICSTIGIDASYSENTEAQHYPVGQEFETHADYFKEDQLGPAGARGQRTYTFMVYLTDVKEGGETDFVKLGIAIKPKPGRAVIWNNLDPQGLPNSYTLHYTRPVVRGSEFTITKWFRAHGAGPMYIKDRTETTRPEMIEDRRRSEPPHLPTAQLSTSPTAMADPRFTPELTDDWADWIKLNIERGGDKDGMFRILLEDGMFRILLDAGFGHQIMTETNSEPAVDLA